MRRQCVALLAMLLAGCEGRGALVSVTNQSGQPLEQIVVTGRGFADTIPRLAPGQAGRVLVHPRGESGVALTFSAPGGHIAIPQQGYLEDCCGYNVRLTVNQALKVDFDYSLERR